MNRFDRFSWVRFGLSALLLFVFACSGGGSCSGCEACGIGPIPGGFPADQTIPNAAQVRLTESGITFIEDNIDPIVANFLPDGLDFPVPRSSFPITGPDPVICPDDDCMVHLEIRSLELIPTAPNVLRAHIEVYLQSQDSTGTPRGLPIDYWACGGNINLDSAPGDREIIGFNADIVFSEETRSPRDRFTRLDVVNAALDPAQPIEDVDIEVRDCLISGLLNFFRGQIIDQIAGQLDSALDSALGDNLCTEQGEFGCPTGTTADGAADDPTAICRFPDGDCVPMLLGTDGQGDLGGTAIGGFSPGTHAFVQLLLAAGGDGEAVNDGMSLFFLGGFMGTNSDFTETPAHNACVPVIDPPPLPVIPRVEAFRGNVIPGTSTETHIGFGIAESYMDYAMYGLFDSGALCIGAGTRLSQQLSTGLLSALVMSLPDLTYPNGNSPITIAIRPQRPPDITLGRGGMDDPVLQIAMPELQMDFYVWSTERYVRFMTFQTDLDIGVDLTVEAGEIVPNIMYVNSNNPVVSNSELLEEDPTFLATTVSTIIGTFASMLGGAVSPFALPDIMGFVLEVPDGGLTSVNDGGENFLGIFANLALAGPMPLTQPTETRLEVTDLELDRESMSPAGWAQGDGNSVWLNFSASGIDAVEYEYSYRIDGTAWSLWTTDERVRIEDDILLLQARHLVEARSRVVGEPRTADPSPAQVELVVDILPPHINVARTVEGVEIEARDLITPREELEFRFYVDGAWSAWSHEASHALATEADGALVEVRDESGNVGSAQVALIRGLPNPAAGDGCGCRAVGGDGDAPLGLLALLGALGAVFFRRRRRGGRGGSRLPFLGLVALVALVASGCDCGSPQIPCGGRCSAASPPGTTAGSLCCESSDMCAMYDVDALCDPGYTCPLENLVLDATCGVTCSMCEAKPALSPGILATHLDMIVDDTGAVFISGYNPGNPSGLDLGDLVFGTWSPGGDVGGTTTWEIVDGAPSTPITNDPTGWRAGVSAPGDDVGRWTSMANQMGTFLITHYDSTNTALRFSAGGPGAWASHTIDDTGDSGRYSSLVVMADGTPVVSYLRMAEDPMTAGQIRGSAMVAMANTMNPSGPTDWTITEVASGVMNCRAELCGGGLGTVCLESGLCVSTTSDCTDTCASPDVCVMGSCQASVPAGFVEDLPPAYGLYTSLAETPTGLALVFYDRTSGNIYGANFDGTAWGAAFHIDGYLLGDPNVGDSGQGANLAVDSGGLWHVVYIDGAEETLRYAQVQSDGTVVSREIVDDGSTSDGTTRFTDGRHIIGDDASIVVDAGGNARVIYQDATSQDAVEAVRGGGGWTIRRFDSSGSTGYWLEQVLLGTTPYAVTFWRERMRRTMSSGVRVTTLD